MARHSAEVLKDALALPDVERAALVDTLIGSLDPIVDADADDAWKDEVLRRLAQIDSGAVALIPWEDARRRLRDRPS